MDPDRRVLTEVKGYHRDVVDIHNTLRGRRIEECPFVQVVVFRHEASVESNYAVIELCRECKAGERAIYDYARERLLELGATLSLSREELPLCYEVANYRHVAQVVDWLYRHNHMTIQQKKQLDGCISEQAKAAEFAASDPEEREKLQKALRPHVEKLMQHASDTRLVLDWVKRMIEVYNVNRKQAIARFWASFNESCPKEETVEPCLYDFAEWYCFPNDAMKFLEIHNHSLSHTTIQKVIWNSIAEYKPKVVKVDQVSVQVVTWEGTAPSFSVARTFALKMKSAKNDQETVLGAIKEFAEYSEYSFRDALKSLSEKPPGTTLLRPCQTETNRVVITFINRAKRVEHIRLKVLPKGDVLCGPKKVELVENFISEKQFQLTPKRCRQMGEIGLRYVAGRLERVTSAVSVVAPQGGARYICVRDEGFNTIWEKIWSEDIGAIVQLSALTGYYPEVGNRMFRAGAISIECVDEQIRYAGADGLDRQGLSVRKFVLTQGFDERKEVYQFTFDCWEEDKKPDVDLMMRLIDDVNFVRGTRPIALQCSDVQGHAGIFIALHHLDNLLSQSEEVAVAPAVETIIKGLKDPLMIPTPTQLLMITTVIEAHFKK